MLLGVPLDPVTQQEACQQIQASLEKNAFAHVVTPNSEMLVAAYKNQSFRDLLNRTDLNLPDSAGLLKAARWTKQRLPERVTGIDTVTHLCSQLSNEHPVFFLGAGEGIAEHAAAALKEQNPALQIAGCYAGSPDPSEANAIIEKINASGAHLLLVAYGSPQQDVWIDQYRDQLTTVRVAMGIGGTFDFLAGAIARAPVWMQKAGLEWLWRLMKQPSRWKRIWTAVVVFPWLVTKNPKPQTLNRK